MGRSLQAVSISCTHCRRIAMAHPTEHSSTKCNSGYRWICRIAAERRRPIARHGACPRDWVSSSVGDREWHDGGQRAGAAGEAVPNEETQKKVRAHNVNDGALSRMANHPHQPLPFHFEDHRCGLTGGKREEVLRVRARDADSTKNAVRVRQSGHSR
jgi:hypothetical protein